MMRIAHVTKTETHSTYIYIIPIVIVLIWHTRVHESLTKLHRRKDTQKLHEAESYWTESGLN